MWWIDISADEKIPNLFLSKFGLPIRLEDRIYNTPIGRFSQESLRVDASADTHYDENGLPHCASLSLFLDVVWLKKLPIVRSVPTFSGLFKNSDTLRTGLQYLASRLSFLTSFKNQEDLQPRLAVERAARSAHGICGKEGLPVGRSA